jgi:hypothetical protein
VRVAIPIDAGRRYRIGAIRARGANAIAQRTLLEELGLDPGAYYDGPALRRSIERARRKLDRRVELRTSLTDGDEIEIEAEIDAGEQRRGAARPATPHAPRASSPRRSPSGRAAGGRGTWAPRCRRRAPRATSRGASAG